jgi:hypothetical protein
MLFVEGLRASSLAAGTTVYTPATGIQDTTVPNEYQTTQVLPAACTAQNMYVVTNSVNGAGILTITLRNAATYPAMANTALTVRVPSGAAAGLYSDTSDTASLAAGSLIDISFSMSAATSASLIGVGFQCK